MRIQSLTKKDDISDESSALTAVVDKINLLVPKFPPEFRSEHEKIIFYLNAVREAPWEFNPVSQLTTQKFKFNGFLKELLEILQLKLNLKNFKTVQSLMRRLPRTIGIVWTLKMS